MGGEHSIMRRLSVLVHGAATAQLALAAGLLDELELHLIPVLFGQGRRLFEGLTAEQIELERTRILEGRAVSPTCTTGSSAEVSVPPPSLYRRKGRNQLHEAGREREALPRVTLAVATRT
jgi:hypothetical protein